MKTGVCKGNLLISNYDSISGFLPIYNAFCKSDFMQLFVENMAYIPIDIVYLWL